MSKWRMYSSIGVVAVMLIVFAYLRISALSKQPASLTETPLEQTVITDADVLEIANPTFYQGVKNGDVVLRYEDRLELYRTSESRVIRSVSLGK